MATKQSSARVSAPTKSAEVATTAAFVLRACRRATGSRRWHRKDGGSATGLDDSRRLGRQVIHELLRLQRGVADDPALVLVGGLGLDDHRLARGGDKAGGGDQREGCESSLQHL